MSKEQNLIYSFQEACRHSMEQRIRYLFGAIPEPATRDLDPLVGLAMSISGLIIKTAPFFTITRDGEPIKTHRKKRIAKKWLKRYGRHTKTVPDERIYQMGDMFICHPETAKRLSLAILSQRNTL